jgi:hypothetical protein
MGIQKYYSSDMSLALWLGRLATYHVTTPKEKALDGSKIGKFQL